MKKKANLLKNLIEEGDNFEGPTSEQDFDERYARVKKIGEDRNLTDKNLEEIEEDQQLQISPEIKIKFTKKQRGYRDSTGSKRSQRKTKYNDITRSYEDIKRESQDLADDEATDLMNKNPCLGDDSSYYYTFQQ